MEPVFIWQTPPEWFRRSEEHTSELQSQSNLVCRLLLVKKNLSRFERRGLKVTALKLIRVSRSLAETYYAEHKGKPFFEPLMTYIAAAPVVAMVLEGDGAVAAVRKMMGKTNSAEAEPGTIRGDLALTVGRNVIHGSDSGESAKREIS